MVHNSGWSEYELYVVSSLDRHEKALGKLHNDMADVKQSVAGLRVKAGVWGAIAGVVSVGIPATIALLAIMGSW